MVPSNIANTAGELEHVIGFTEAGFAITEPDFCEVVQRGIDAAGTDTTTVVARGRLAGFFAFDDLPGLSEEPPPRPAVGGDDVAELLFTSGTTSKPKAVMLTHANCLRAGLDTVHCLWLDEDERCLTALPLFHVNGQGMTIMAAMTVGGTAIVIEEFSASRFWEQVRRHKAIADGDRRDAAAHADRPAAERRGQETTACARSSTRSTSPTRRSRPSRSATRST